MASVSILLLKKLQKLNSLLVSIKHRERPLLLKRCIFLIASKKTKEGSPTSRKMAFMLAKKALVINLLSTGYRNSQKHESTLLHTYVMNEFLRADRSCAPKWRRFRILPNNWPIWTQKVPKEAFRCEQPTSLRVFQKYFVAHVHERSAVKNSFITYVWSKVDSCFFESVYIRALE